MILIVTMLLGRHRGLLASMKDQEVIQYSAKHILLRRQQELSKPFRSIRSRDCQTEKDIDHLQIEYF